jgi:beta-galactosidase
MRTVIHLNDDWEFRPRPVPDFWRGADREEPAGAVTGSAWQPVRLPTSVGELPFSGFDETAYQMESGYRRRFRLAPPAAGKRVRLHFEGVMAAARVWLNGRELGGHRGGYTPFMFDITDCLADCGDNFLAVLVDSTERPDIPPFGYAIDYLTYGGIYREAWLEILDGRSIGELRVETAVLDAAGVPLAGGPVLTLELGLSEAVPGTCRISAAIAPAEGGEALLSWDFPVGPAAGEGRRAVWSGPIPGVRPWDIDDPQLYRLELSLVDAGGEVLDRVVERIGFRQVEFRADGFFLNGRPLKLRGLNRHQAWPYAGYAMPRSAQAADADNLRHHLGCNIVRQSHYPQSRHFLARCDEIGLLVFAELPGWQHIGDQAWQDLACDNLAELIRRDRNHPSVIIWGVRINESADNAAFYRRTNALARRLDPTRPTGGVRNFGGSQFLEDVYTYNDFVHSGANRALEPADRIAGRGRPYLVSEHNGHMYPTKKYDPEPRRIEHALRHARVLDAMYASRRISGAIGWCMADYNTHADFGSGDHICHHGVQDMFRIDKLAAAVYRSQQEKEPYGEVASAMAAGDHDAATLRGLMVFTNSEEVRVYRGDRLLGAFRPDRRRWKHLPHPPVPIDDLIGDALMRDEGLPPGEAAIVKRFMLAMNSRGGLPFPESLPMAFVMLKRGWGYTTVYNLFARYLSGWGGKLKTYRFEGWSAGRLEWVRERGPGHAARLTVSVDRNLVKEAGSWECCRVEVRLLDQHGNDLAYCQESALLEVEGPLEIIGPATRPLSAGSGAWWLRSTGRSGTAWIRAKCGQFVSESLEVLVDSAQS